MITQLNCSKHRGESIAVRARRGASMPIVLVLFLVCTLLASAVFAAATAAAGRGSQQAEAEQRYYSVMSAANLVAGQFDGAAVELECVQTKDVTTEIAYNDDGTMTRGTPNENITGYEVRVNGATIASGTDAIAFDKSTLKLSELTGLYMLMGSTSSILNPQTAWSRSLFEVTDELDIGTFSLTNSIDTAPVGVDVSELQPKLEVAVTQKALPGGDILLQFESVGDETEKYTTALWCRADSDTVESSKETWEPVAPSGSGLLTKRTEKAHVTTYRKTTLSWQVSNLASSGAGA